MELDQIKMQVREGLGRLLPRLSQYKYALIVLLVGILLLYAGGGARDRPESNQPSGTEKAGFDLDSFEQELTDKLSKIAGIGRVELMLSLEQTGESVYASISGSRKAAARAVRMRVPCQRSRMAVTGNSLCASRRPVRPFAERSCCAMVRARVGCGWL